MRHAALGAAAAARVAVRADLVAPAARVAMAARVADRRTATRIVPNGPTVRHQSKIASQDSRSVDRSMSGWLG
jgi:hypothetical protein